MGKGMVSGVCIGNDYIILVKNEDPEKPMSYGLPGGIIEDNETVEEALRREWNEEVGQESGPILLIKDRISIKKNGPYGEYTHYVILVKDSGNVLRATGVPNEVGPPERIPLQDILSGKVAIFKSHLRAIEAIQELLKTSEKELSEKPKKPKKSQLDRNGIPFLS